MGPLRDPKSRGMHVAPFFSRAYGGYSKAQALFLAEILPECRGVTIADPMSGQGLLVSAWAHKGARVFLADINPGPLALATLRAPNLIYRRERHLAQFQELMAD